MDRGAGADANDLAATARTQVWRRGLDAEEGPGQVGVDATLPLGKWKCLDRLVGGANASVQEDEVEATMPGVRTPINCSTASEEVTSATMALALPPRSVIARAVSSISSRLRALHTTCAPSAAQARAIARPMPRPAPVTTATWVASALPSGVRVSVIVPPFGPRRSPARRQTRGPYRRSQHTLKARGALWHASSGPTLKERAMPYAELSTGIDLYYERIGEGPPLLLIPSSSLGAAVWHPEPAGRLARNFTVITFDPRGIGRSVAPDEFLSLWQLAADSADLLACSMRYPRMYLATLSVAA